MNTTLTTLWRASQYVVVAALAVVLALGVSRCDGGGKKLSRLTVLVSGQTMAYLEHCGCASGVTGGELRKARLIHQERDEARKPKPADKGLPADVVLVELGDFVDSAKPVDRLLSEGVVMSMQKLGYASVGLGLQELELPQSELWSLIGDSGLKFCAANLSFTKPEVGEDHSADLNGLLQPYRIETLESGYRVGIVHVVDERVNGMRDAEQREFSKLNGFSVGIAFDAASRVLQEHNSEADFWILTAGTGILQGLDPQLFATLPHVTLIIGIEGSNPGLEPFPAFIDRPHQKAKDVVRSVVNFRGKQNPVVISDRLNLLENIKEDEYVKSVIEELKPKLEALENQQATIAFSEQLNMPKPWYVGHNQCMTCHSDIVNSLAHTRHRMAFENLTHRDPKAQKNPVCLECHVTGYNKPGGWISVAPPATKELMKGVSCEACHGPGEYHVQLQSNPDWEKPANFAEAGRGKLGIVGASQQTCLKCHDRENSPAFRFETYWPHIQHDLLMSIKPQEGSPSKDTASAGLQGRGFGVIPSEEGHAHSHGEEEVTE